MDGGPLREPENLRPRRPRASRAAWCAACGVIGGTAIVICLAAGILSVRRAIALGLPAALLIIGGVVIAVSPDPVAGRRAGFRAGFLTGSLLSRWRSAFRRRRNGH